MSHATTNFKELVPDLKERMFAWRQCGNGTATYRARTCRLRIATQAIPLVFDE